MYRYILLITLLTVSTGVTGATHTNVTDLDINAHYESSALDTKRTEVSISCNSNEGYCPGEAGSGATLKACGNFADEKVWAGDSVLPNGGNSGTVSYTFSFYIHQVPCDIGSNLEAFNFEATDADGKLRVDETGGKLKVGTNIEGYNLKVVMNKEKFLDGTEADLVTFNLRDDSTDSQIIVEEHDYYSGNEKETFPARLNYIFSDTNDNLKQFIDQDDFSSTNSQVLDVIEQGFATETSKVWKAECGSDSKSEGCVIGYDDAHKVYYPKTEIIAGKYYSDGGPPDKVKDVNFYSCRAADKYEGITVYSPGNNYEYDQFRCDSGTGQWLNVALCNDGRNNDQEGGTDLNDVDCNGNPNQNSEKPQKCSPFISSDVSNTNGDDITEKVALYDYNSNGNGQYSPASSSCTYDSIDDDVEYHNKPAEGFVCEDTKAKNYDGPTAKSKMNKWCTNLDTRLDFSSAAGLPDPMPSVQYFIPKRAIPEGQNKWATSNGFKPNYGRQALHDAEKEYSGDETNHDTSTWSQRTMEGLSGYSNDNPDNYIDAWKIGNATGLSNTDVDQQSGTIKKDGVFDGGFYGNCEPGNIWVRNGGEWGCDPGDVSNQRMIINTYYLKNLRDDSGNPTYAGFRINTSELRKWQAAHLVSAGADTDLINPVQVRAQCWHGGPGDKPPVSEVANVTETVEKTSNGKLKNMSVIADLPATSVNKDQPRSYTCIFGLRQAVYRDSDGNTPKYASTSTNVWFNGEPGYSDQPTTKDAAYIAEGVDFNGMIRTKTQPITVPVTEEFEGTELDWLKSNESDTYTGSTNLWSQFTISDAATSKTPCKQDENNLELVKHPSYSAKHNCGEK